LPPNAFWEFFSDTGGEASEERAHRLNCIVSFNVCDKNRYINIGFVA
jgi:hypothetical protein